MAMMSQLGTLVGSLGSGVLLGGSPEWVKYIFISIGLLVFGLITIFGIKETPLPGPVPKINWGPYIKTLWIDPRKYPDFAWVWITRALVMLGFYSVLPFINYYLVDVIRVKDADRDSGLLIATLLFMSSISGIVGGRLSDRFGKKRVVYLANMTIAVMSITFIFCRSITDVLIAGTMFGLGYGAYISVDWALGTQVLPSKSHAAKEMAVWHISMTLPQTIASPAAGFLIAAFGKSTEGKGAEQVIHYTTAGYSSVFILCAVCFGLGAVFLRNVRGVS